MTELEKTWRRVFPVARQLADEVVRRRALATLRAGDVVQAVDLETHEAVRTGRVVATGMAEHPRRWWCFDEAGRECRSWGGAKAGGLLVIRPWLTPDEAERLVREGDATARPTFSWALYEQHMDAVAAAVGRGDLEMPEEPWA